MFGKRKCTAYVLMGLVAVTVTVQADRLEPVLRARDVSGTVTVQRADHTSFEPIEEGFAYAYGSRFVAAAESSVTLEMAAGHTVRVLANTEIVFTEGSENPRIKTVRLIRGEVEASLGQKFHQGGHVLQIEAANALTQAVGTRYRVASRYEQDLQIVIIRVLAGVVRVLGENFEVAELQADQWLSLLSPPDESFLRLKNMRGAFDITVKDEEKENRRLPTEEGSVLKIWQRVVTETGERVVTAVFSDPDGQMVETVSVTFGPGEFADFWADVQRADEAFPRDSSDAPPRPRRVPRDPYPEGDNPMPPDDFMDELVERAVEDLSPGFGKTEAAPAPPPPPPPRPPQRPTPTPVGNQ